MQLLYLLEESFVDGYEVATTSKIPSTKKAAITAGVVCVCLVSLFMHIHCPCSPYQYRLLFLGKNNQNSIILGATDHCLGYGWGQKLFGPNSR